mmetsp:Transcript_63572/g.133975  ORF Transcript_63572/g.133975 Transcript_63572/m.133975 type:complete len:101 (+) Transcript_63572:268-570(+)
MSEQVGVNRWMATEGRLRLQNLTNELGRYRTRKPDGHEAGGSTRMTSFDARRLLLQQSLLCTCLSSPACVASSSLINCGPSDARISFSRTPLLMDFMLAG